MVRSHSRAGERFVILGDVGSHADAVNPEDRVAALCAFGFTDRQVRFLVLVLEHAGVCLTRPLSRCALRRASRQHRACAGIAHGLQTQRLFGELVAGGFATGDLSAPARAGRIFDVRYKPRYHALGEADHRHRKPMSAGRTVDPSTET